MAQKKEPHYNLVKYNTVVVAETATIIDVPNSSDRKKSSVLKKIRDFINNNDKLEILKYKDLISLVVDENEDFYVYSRLRGVTVWVKNLVFEWQHENEDAMKRIESVFKIIMDADTKYTIDNSSSVNGEYYMSLMEEAYYRQCTLTDKCEAIKQKQQCKQQAKANTKFKYRIGDIYGLTMRTLDGKTSFSEVYKVRKFVYTVGNTPVNIVIMKLIAGNIPRRRSISPNDCRAFHIKYENDLYVFSMNTRFTKLSEDDFGKWKSEYEQKHIQVNVKEEPKEIGKYFQYSDELTVRSTRPPYDKMPFPMVN